MIRPKIGSLFSGYEGLGMAVAAALGGEVAWVSDIDKGANKILAHRFPDLPNIGDITKVDWSAVTPVEIICAGFPCQDVSGAGRQAGLRRGTRTGLWHEVVTAIRTLRPSVVVLENVLGLLSAMGDEPSAELVAAETSVSLCDNLLAWLAPRITLARRRGHDAQRLVDRRVRVMGLRDRAVARAGEARRSIARAIATVLGSLASLGFDAEWVCVNASDVGAPHRRTRVFILAWPADAASDARRVLNGDHGTAAHAERGGLNRRSPDQVGLALERAAVAWGGEGARLLPSPRTTDTNGPGEHGDGGLDLRTAVSMLPTPMARDFKGCGPADAERNSPALSAVSHLLPTPAINDMEEGKTVEQWDGWTQDMQARHGNGNGHGKSLAIEAQRLLPTPRAGDGEKGGPNQRGSSGDLMLPSAAILLPTPTTMDAHASGGGYNGQSNVTLTDATVRRTHGPAWGQYAAAINRWEAVTRPAPAPTELGPKGSPRLAARFSEWMMGVPAGWITDVPDLTRNEALKACGNGVVPQQAVAAIDQLARRALASLAVAA